MEGLFDMERNGYKSIIHDHDRDPWMTTLWMFECAINFKCRRVVDTYI